MRSSELCICKFTIYIMDTFNDDMRMFTFLIHFFQNNMYIHIKADKRIPTQLFHSKMAPNLFLVIGLLLFLRYEKVL